MNMAKSIREFIYLDIPKLYSFYSQVFDGLTKSVINEKIDQLITGDSQGSFIAHATAQTQAVEATKRVETSILHDHMYNRLESELGTAILDASNMDKAEIEARLSEASVIKISGRSEIEDYERIRIFFDKFNELGEAIAYAALSNDPSFTKKLVELQDQLEQTGRKSGRTEIERKIEKLKDPKFTAKELGLWQDPKLLGALKFFSELFNPTGYDIVITPKERATIHYKGILDRTWLRNDPRLISSLYGGQSEAPWSMVGIITNMPGTFVSLVNNDEQLEAGSAVIEESNEINSMMLDAYRNMFRTERVFERLFLESKTDLEIVVSPIAVYREFQITN